MTNEKQNDEALKAYKQRVNTVVTRLKADLKDWIYQHQGDDMFADPPGDINASGYGTEVTTALLETAIDRKIHLLGEKDARESVMSAFDRRAKLLRQQLH